MRTLKDQISRDRRVFLNPREFGGEMLVDGVACIGSWDEEEEQPIRQYFTGEMEDATGVFTRERVLFYMRAGGGTLVVPVPGQDLNIDGRRWTVRDANQESGIVEANLFRNES